MQIRFDTSYILHATIYLVQSTKIYGLTDNCE